MKSGRAQLISMLCVKSMEIFDHTGQNLTKCKVITSDHAPLILEVELKARKSKQEKAIIAKFNDKSLELKFKEST